MLSKITYTLFSLHGLNRRLLHTLMHHLVFPSRKNLSQPPPLGVAQFAVTAFHLWILTRISFIKEDKEKQQVKNSAFANVFV